MALQWKVGSISLVLCAAVSLSGPVFGQENVETSDLNLRIVADAEDHVFMDYETARCNNDDLPDAPFRVIRNFKDELVEYGSNFENHINVGKSLDKLEHKCDIAYEGRHNPNPKAYDDRTWIMSPWTENGRTVYAFGHNEYQPWTFDGMCVSVPKTDCWYVSTLLLTSQDGGYRFSRTENSALVAGPSTEYKRDQKGPVGFFSPSNILFRQEKWYSLIGNRSQEDASGGACLYRSTDITKASSWLGYDGSSFSISSAVGAESENRRCKHITPFNGPVRALVSLADRGVALALYQSKDSSGQNKYFLSASTSADLIHWSPSVNIIDKSTGQPLSLASGASVSCTEKYLYAYPSILDPASLSRNFDTVGQAARLYMVRFKISPKHCTRLEYARSIVWRQLSIVLSSK